MILVAGPALMGSVWFEKNLGFLKILQLLPLVETVWRQQSLLEQSLLQAGIGLVQPFFCSPKNLLPFRFPEPFKKANSYPVLRHIRICEFGHGAVKSLRLRRN